MISGWTSGISHEGVAAGCEGLREWAYDALVGEDGYTFKDGEVCTLLNAETVCGLLWLAPMRCGVRGLFDSARSMSSART